MERMSSLISADKSSVEVWVTYQMLALNSHRDLPVQRSPRKAVARRQFCGKLTQYRSGNDDP